MNKSELQQKIFKIIESTDVEIRCPKVALPASMDKITDDLTILFKEHLKPTGILKDEPRFYTDW